MPLHGLDGTDDVAGDAVSTGRDGVTGTSHCWGHRTVKESDRQVDKIRRFVCTECGLASERRYNHETHLRTHNPDPSKMFPCPHDGCDKIFTRRHDLKRHLESKRHRHD
ncbi:hypothetical protein A0H81_12142 [Grifola frondosa]|uniref:C2H2-type domain-containing protein n=1 Tax=Grifola frondosa TaxID=5627 RepID=A0A1C7LTC4_GRIFR|nr:hypothetical protein A0H81_12142 [Grifola frondosa]